MVVRTGTFRRVIRVAVLMLASILIAGFGAWGAGALWFQFPAGPVIRAILIAFMTALSITALVLLFRRRMIALSACALPAALLLAWWLTILPSNGRIFADEVREMTSGTVDGDMVSVENVRNFQWRSRTDYTERWENRRYDLSKLASVDLFLSYWTGPSIAHTLVSFGFADGTYVTFSVEIRKEKTEAFSTIGGFFKLFEMSVVAADERDIVYLRTNVRKEDVQVLRIAMPQTAMKSLFLAYLDEANMLRDTPRFYHTLTANCTTIVYQMVSRIVPGLPIDYRLVLSGYLPEYIGKVNGLTPGFTVEELRQAGRISARAQAIGDDPGFSGLIRAGIPGMGITNEQ